MNKTLQYLVMILLFEQSFAQSDQMYVDFRYAPSWHITNICLPDDAYKTLVGPEGQLFYDFGGTEFFPYAGSIIAGWKGFRTVFHFLPDEKTHFNGQTLYSPKVPIVQTLADIHGMSVIQESFAIISQALLEGSREGRNVVATEYETREDIILTTIKNTSKKRQTINPLLVINSEHIVHVNNKTVIVQYRLDEDMRGKKTTYHQREFEEEEKLLLTHEVVRTRQNLGDFKTIVELAPIMLEVGEEVALGAIYDNGKDSNYASQINTNPESVISLLKAAKKQAIDYWETTSPVPFNKISVPDAEIQGLLDSSLRNIWQAREILDGKISFQVGPTVYRGLWIVDAAFFIETATMMGKGLDARDGIDYILSFQQPNGHFGKLQRDYWKESGMVLWAVVRHAMLMQDKEILKSHWAKLSKTVRFLADLRKQSLDNDTPLDDGLMPPGMINGGLMGDKDMPEYSNVHWNLAGLKAMIKGAEWIEEKKDAKAWQKEYDDFYASYEKAALRDLATDDFGNQYLPVVMDPEQRSLPQRAQWAFCHGVYPGQVFPKDDPIARGTMNMLSTTLQEGMVMGTGWAIDGIWNYFASFYGHAWLWMGDGQKAAESLYAFANHASPMLTWREEHNPRDLSQKFVGDMPHNWASAELVRLAVHLLALDREDEMHLFEGLPKAWTQKGMETSLNEIVTPFGALSFNLKVNDSGDSATLKVAELSNPACEGIVVHLDGWAAEAGSDKVIRLDPGKSHEIEIDMN